MINPITRTKKELFNTTGFPISVYNETGLIKLYEIPPREGPIPRLRIHHMLMGSLEYYGVPTPVISPGELKDIPQLPLYAMDCDLVVTRYTGESIKQHYPHFKGLLLNPDTGDQSAVYNKAGKVIGVRRFICLNLESLIPILCRST